MTLFLGLAGAAFVLVLLAGRRWTHLHANDLGTMSRQWLAEHNSQHP